MRWLIPAAVVVTGLGVLMLYVPPWKGAALIVPPQAAYVLVLAGVIGIVVGVVRAWWSRSNRPGGVAAGTGSDPKGAATGRSHRLADETALAGLALAVAALLAVATVFFFEPIIVSVQGPDPCGAAKGVRQPDTACVLAHPDYYQYDPVAGSISTRGSLISQSVGAVAGPAIVPLALVAVLISWLALAMGTRRRRLALSVLTLSGLIVVWMGLVFLALIFGGGD